MTSVFADRLRALRRAAGLTMEQLAEASGVSARAISDMERGHSRAPQARTLAALADGLGLLGDDRAGLVAAAKEARSPSAAGRPRLCELPRGVTDFVSRTGELATVARAAKRAGTGDGPPPVLVVHGQPGLGKTAFAIRAAEELRDGFPDGCLHLDLRGVDPEPVPVGEALRRLLRALDVKPGLIAGGDDERSAHLRGILRDRRCLLVLDNAGSEAQVRPLLPADGSGLVIVTSRRALAGLEGVLRIALPPLTPFESADLLGAIAAQAADPDAAEQVASVSQLCGHLPLALRIAGTRLASRPQWTVGNLVDRLADTDRRLAALSAGDTGVASSFALSHAQLSAPAAVLFRRLAHVPGPDFAAPLAAVLAETGLVEAEDGLDELVELGLLQPEGADRYRFHDLIRLYAGERLAAEETADTRAATRERMTGWLLDTATVAGRWYEPGYGRLPDGYAGLVPLATRDEGGAWLRAERENWLSALRAVAAQGRHQDVATVVGAFGYFADTTPQWPSWVEVYGLASAAAAALPNRKQHVDHLTNYAWTLLGSGGRAAESAAVAMEAHRLAVEIGDLLNQSLTLQFAAAAWRNMGRLDDALRACGEAIELAERGGNHSAYGQQMVTYGFILETAGRLDEAMDRYRRVLAELDDRPMTPITALSVRAGALSGITTVQCAREQWAECLHTAALGIPVATEITFVRLLGRMRIAAGTAHAALGDTAKARADLVLGIGELEEGIVAGSALDLRFLGRARETLALLAGPPAPEQVGDSARL